MKNQEISIFGGPWKFDAQHFFHFRDDGPGRDRLAGLPRVDVGLGDLDELGELLLVPALGVAGLRDGDLQVVRHGGR